MFVQLLRRWCSKNHQKSPIYYIRKIKIKSKLSLEQSSYVVHFVFIDQLGSCPVMLDNIVILLSQEAEQKVSKEASEYRDSLWSVLSKRTNPSLF